MATIVDKIEKAGLLGRGGASFPTHLKWRAVQSEKCPEKYLVVNGAEGEPGAFKDAHIVKNHTEELVEGVRLAAYFIRAKKIFFYLNESFYSSKNKIKKIANDKGLGGRVEFFLKPSKYGYIAGEESSVLNIIEGRTPEPRLKPPFPTCQGLYGKPTLVNNIETLYNVSLVSRKKYQQQRFYSINVGKENVGVYHLPDNLSIAEVLKLTNNYPQGDFFVQVGGNASGEVLNKKQLKRKVDGVGSITIYDLAKHSPEKLIKSWLDFFKSNSCGQCVPCREGSYRLSELFGESGVGIGNDPRFADLCDTLLLSSFCALGSSVPVAVASYLKNIFEPLILEQNDKRKK